MMVHEAPLGESPLHSHSNRISYYTPSTAPPHPNLPTISFIHCSITKTWKSGWCTASSQ